MKNKEWLDELNEMHDKGSFLSKKEIDEKTKELEDMLNAAIKKKNMEPQSDWDIIQRAKEFNKENNNKVQTNPIEFNKKSYDENDKIAKDIMINFLNKKGHIIENSIETYSIDIITNKGKYEVEMSSKDFTTRESFPYEKVNFLGRKKKYGNMYYVIISNNKEYALVANSKDIYIEENRQIVFCNTIRQGYDEVYQLNKDKVKFFKL